MAGFAAIGIWFVVGFIIIWVQAVLPTSSATAGMVVGMGLASIG
jgi:hypothetical protein